MGVERCAWLELLPAYALGALDAGEAGRLEAHLRGRCGACEAELTRLQHDLRALAESVPPVSPTTEARGWLIDSIRPRPWYAGRPALAAAAAIAVVMAAGALGRGATLANQLESAERESLRLAAALGSAEQQLATSEAALRAGERALAVLGGARLQQIQLAGLEAAPGATAQGLVDPTTRRALLTARGLPALAAGRTYQLWLIAEGAAIPAGTFDATLEGRGRLLIERLPVVEGIDAWAVTEEPAGGVGQPTGAMVLKG